MTRRLGRDGWWLAAMLVGVLASAPAAQAKRTFVYLHDRNLGGGIYGFAMDGKGQLTPLPGSPWALVDDGGECGGACQTMAYSSKRKMLVTGGVTGVTAWIVAKDGSLSVAPGSPAVVGSEVLGTGVVQIKKRVFVFGSVYFDDEIARFELQQDGTLTSLGTTSLPAGSLPDGLATSKTSVFVANEGLDVAPSTLASFAAQPDGNLLPAPGSPFEIPDNEFVFNVWPDPKGKRVYVYDDGIETDGSVIHGWSVDKGTAALTPLAGSPFLAFPDGPKAGLAVAKKLLFAIDYDDGSNDIQPFRIDKKGGLTDTGIVIDSNLPILVFAINSKGKRLLVASSTQLISAKVEDKQGSLDAQDVVGLPGVNPNALLIVKR